MTDQPPLSPELDEIEADLRSSAKAIREHVPDATGSFPAVATSASDPDRQMIAGPLHVVLLDKAADTIRQLREQVREAKVALEPFAEIGGSEVFDRFARVAHDQLIVASPSGKRYCFIEADDFRRARTVHSKLGG